MYIEKNLWAHRQREKLRLELEQECNTRLNCDFQIEKKIKDSNETTSHIKDIKLWSLTTHMMCQEFTLCLSKEINISSTDKAERGRVNECVRTLLLIRLTPLTKTEILQNYLQIKL